MIHHIASLQVGGRGRVTGWVEGEGVARRRLGEEQRSTRQRGSEQKTWDEGRGRHEQAKVPRNIGTSSACHDATP